MRLIQVTIGAAATQITANQIYASVLLIQKNTANNCRVGDKTVTSSKGIVVPAGNTTPVAPLKIGRSDNRIPLFEYYIAGTQNDVVDVLYEQG
jgi:hypothetical protein